MAFNLKDFTSNFYHNNLDVARSNLFSVHINPNTALYNNKIVGDTSHIHEETGKLKSSLDTARLSKTNLSPIILLASGVTTPALSIAVGEGTAFHSYPHSTTKGELTVSFLLDSKMLPLTFFTEWMNKIHDPYSMKYGFFNSYIGNITVYTYDSTMKSPKTITQYVEVYPISITTPQLAFGVDSKILDISVTFDYRSYFLSSIDDQLTTNTFTESSPLIATNSNLDTVLSTRNEVFNNILTSSNNNRMNTTINNITSFEDKILTNTANYGKNKPDNLLGNLSLGVSGVVGQVNSVINSVITNPLNAIQTVQGTVFGNIQKLRMPISNVNAQVNVIKGLPTNVQSQINTIKF